MTALLDRHPLHARRRGQGSASVGTDWERLSQSRHAIELLAWLASHPRALDALRDTPSRAPVLWRSGSWVHRDGSTRSITLTAEPLEFAQHGLAFAAWIGGDRVQTSEQPSVLGHAINEIVKTYPSRTVDTGWQPGPDWVSPQWADIVASVLQRAGL